MRCSTLRGTFCSLITLATPRQDWTGSNPSRREGGVWGFTLSRSHSCCAVRRVYIQISPGHIWTTLYIMLLCKKKRKHFSCFWREIWNFRSYIAIFRQIYNDVFAQLWLETLVQRLECRECCVLDLCNDISSSHHTASNDGMISEQDVVRERDEPAVTLLR